MVDRRKFIAAIAASGAAVHLPSMPGLESSPGTSPESEAPSPVDFRYAPRNAQSTICFPDDAFKTVVGPAGDLRYGFAKGLLVGMEDFRTVVSFSLAGFQDDRVARHWIESPSCPIVHTSVERPAATLESIGFASNDPSEGRVDNVLLRIKSKSSLVQVVPKIHFHTSDKLQLLDYNSPLATVVSSQDRKVVLLGRQIGSDLGTCTWWEEQGFTLYGTHGEAGTGKPLEYFFRLPQQNQSAEALLAKLDRPDELLTQTRSFWQNWKPYGSTSWSFPARHGEFLIACARNIQQAREVKDDRLVFQVGPTVYRGLWIVDGNFLLEAARYLGYDKEADEGLRSEWSKQIASGQIIASGGGEHWKDTAIAMYTLVRQCELKQDWSLFRELEPNLLRAIDFLIGLRDSARKGDSTNGRYGLLAPGFADGGVGGVRSEFTNTVWTLAGLQAVVGAAARLNLNSFSKAEQFHRELTKAFQQAAQQEMVQYPGGFKYLPMLAHDDPAWKDRDPWARPRPQSAQWALSQAIYPGTIFQKNDPIVTGHMALLQSCTREDVPAETGWLWHDCVWNYNASFAAHVYLWAGQTDWAHRTFTGFLNHASPLYCWREEQPLQQALVGQDWGDMPHNWASAECVRYLRHMLALEDGDSLRLLNGITSAELRTTQGYTLENSPTRFGRIHLRLEPIARRRWSLHFERLAGPTPANISLPAKIGALHIRNLRGASTRPTAAEVQIDPAARKWEAILE